MIVEYEKGKPLVMDKVTSTSLDRKSGTVVPRHQPPELQLKHDEFESLTGSLASVALRRGEAPQSAPVFDTSPTPTNSVVSSDCLEQVIFELRFGTLASIEALRAKLRVERSSLPDTSANRQRPRAIHHELALLTAHYKYLKTE
jgi:hypothetical protein